MICLRSYSYNAYTNGSEEYLWFFPGTFYIREVVPRSTGDVHTLVYSLGFPNGVRVAETAREIEEKINAEKEQP